MIMSRQSITLTDKNDAWLRYQVEETGEYNTKSELINDLVCRDLISICLTTSTTSSNVYTNVYTF